MRRTGFLVMTGVAALIAVFAFLAETECHACGQAKSAIASSLIEPGPNSAPRSQNRATSGPYTLALPAVYREYDPSYVSPFGIVMYGNVDNADGLQMMKDAGAKSATTMLFWSAIQPTQGGSLDWSSFDTKAQNAQAAGIDLFVLFTGNPSWAAENPSGVVDAKHLVSFVSAMVNRYNCDGRDDAPGHPCVRNWSFYPEPDKGGEAVPGYSRQDLWWGHNGAKYAAMLREISPIIQAADPQAKVLIGGLAYDWFEDDNPPGPFVRSFLADTLAELNGYSGGPSAYIDAVAFHFYPPKGQTISDKAAEIRGIMASQGAANLPLLSPEMGSWSSPKFYSSEQLQANWLLQNYVRGIAIDLKLLSWYKVFDDVVPESGADRSAPLTAGLLRLDGTRKPAYYVYQTMTRELAGARYVGPFQAGGIEGYVFAAPGGPQRIVLWSRAGSIRVVFPYTHLRVVTATGDAQYDIGDNQLPAGAPGDLDPGIAGQILLEIDENPIYVERK